MIPHIHMSPDIYFKAPYLLSNVKMMTEIHGERKGDQDHNSGRGQVPVQDKETLTHPRLGGFLSVVS